jgi:hypothetical protein
MKATSQVHALATLTMNKELAIPTGLKPLNIPEKGQKFLPFPRIEQQNVLHIAYQFTNIAVSITPECSFL